ncbi:MAG: PIG-L family deacetylase [Verrucomicrobiales bacterium]|nr:PIG-L family deacetylase [Verrucomicrobiales bacterium]
MTPYHDLVRRMVGLQEEGERLALGGFGPAAAPVLPDNAPKAFIFSPHPDDECIIGALPLRLLREAGVRVVNVAVTQGSNPARQAGRLAELRAACEYLGFDLVQTAPNGLAGINPRSRAADPAAWREGAAVIAGLVAEHRPRILFLPHERDWNSTHIGVHLLVTDALRQLGAEAACVTIETEFWGAMDDPNLMVEVTGEQLGDLMAATSFHVGEVQRNPYHLLLPAWMQDNVRRGGELVGGQGGTPPRWRFATLYRLGRWNGETIEKVEPTERMLGASTPLGPLFG